MSLLDDLLSQDPHRIWSASCAIRILRDRHVLIDLAQNIDLIKEHTKGINLGGALRPNLSHLEFAIRKLAFIQTGAECLCALYPLDDLYSPNKEEEAGNIRIESTNLIDDKWVDYYLCSCTSCNARFRVEEREYHYPWWAWQRA